MNLWINKENNIENQSEFIEEIIKKNNMNG